MGVNDALADGMTAGQVDLMRFDSAARRKTLHHLFQLEGDLEGKIRRWDLEGVKRTAFKQRRAEALLKDTRSTIDTAYRKMGTTMRSELMSVAKFQADRTIAIANKALGADIVTARLTPDLLKSLVDDRYILGTPLKEWWSKQSIQTQGAFAQQIRLGAIQGETNAQIIQRVRGRATGRFITSIGPDGATRKVREFAGGIMDTSRRHAESAVRTSVQSIGNAINHEVYQENGDVIKGELWVATLDGRTTHICIGLSGGAWDLEGNPLPESPVQGPFPGPPPAHVNCRSVLAPLTKSWEDLVQETTGAKKKIVENFDVGTRASMDGQVPADLSFDGFLKRKGDPFARKLLGPGRFQLWKEGKITLPQLIDQSGRPLTIEQLKKLRPSATPPVQPPVKPPAVEPRRSRGEVLRDWLATQDAEVRELSDRITSMSAARDDALDAYLQERNARNLADLFDDKPAFDGYLALSKKLDNEIKVVGDRMSTLRAGIRDGVKDRLTVKDPIPLKIKTPPRTRPEIRQAAKEAEDWITSIVSKKKIPYDPKDGIMGGQVSRPKQSFEVSVKTASQKRAFYDNGTIHLSDGRVHTAIHETAHAIEDRFGNGVLRKTLDFMLKRAEKFAAAGERVFLGEMPTIFPGMGYSLNERVWVRIHTIGGKQNAVPILRVTPDDQSTANFYVSKWYSDPTARTPATFSTREGFRQLAPNQLEGATPFASEVFSMGMEHLYRDAAAFARADPEFFDFIVGLIG